MCLWQRGFVCLKSSASDAANNVSETTPIIGDVRFQNMQAETKALGCHFRLCLVKVGLSAKLL